jgi:hypothetical protein
VSSSDANAKVILDLNNHSFQENLFSLQKTERHAALDTLSKIRQLTWQQLYRDKGLRWELMPFIPSELRSREGQQHFETAPTCEC